MAKSKGRRLAEWLRNLDSNSKASSDTLADDSVTAAKIADDAVTNAAIADGAVHTANLADANVTFAKLHTDVTITSSTGISASNDNNTTVPTTAALIDYVGAQIQTKDNSDEITEGSTNLYFTNERVDDRVSSLLTAGTGITLTYDDTANTLTVAGAAQYGDSDARSALSVTTNSAGTAALAYNSSTGVFTYTPPNLSSYLTSYTETDTLDSVTARGNSTSNSITVGNATITGNLTVQGTTTTLDTATLNVEDKNITINYSTGDSSGSANGAGITIQDAVDSTTDATILWDTTNDEFDFSHAINVNGKITANNEVRIDNGSGGTTHLNYQDGGANYIRGTTTYVDTTLDLNQNNIIDAGSITATGATFTGDVSISTTSAVPLILKDSNATGNSAAIYINYKDQTNTVVGYVGMGSSSNGDNYLYATSGSPHLYSGNNSAPKYNNNTIWHAGNDGSGSGLDADTLDGLNSGSFLRSDTSDTFTGNLTIASGSLTLPAGYNLQWGAGYNSGKSTIWSDGTANIIRMAPTGNSSGKTLELTATATTSIVDLQADADIQSKGQIRAQGWWNTPTGNYGDAAVEIGMSSGDGYILSYNRNSSSYTSLNFAGTSFNFDERGGTTTIEGNEIWHAGNDGSGSGLDADLLDGISSGSFLRSDVDDQMLALLYGGFGAGSTAGTTNWNDSTNARSGGGYTLLLGSHTNGPGGSYYYHPFSFEYSSKNGSGNMTQFAIPYTGSNLAFRSRYSSSWSGWTTVWTSGNDGSGSGLDADTLDGQHASAFLTGNQTITLTGDVTGSGTTSITTAVANDSHNHTFSSVGGITDLNSISNTGRLEFRPFVTNFQASNRSGSNYNGGFEVGTGATNYGAQFVFEANGASTPPKFRNKINSTWGSWYSLWHTGNDGSGSGLDADTVDGIQASNFLRSDTSDTMSGTLTITNPTYGGISIGESATNYNGWNTQLNVHGSSHSRVHVKTANVSMGIYAHDSWHSGYAGHVGTYTNHPLSFICNASQKAVLTTAGSLSTTSQGTLWGASNDGSGSGLDADNLDGYTWGTSGKNVTAENFDVVAGNGKALRFWGGSSSYQIAMSASGESGYGRMAYETTSDYNMYFRMSGTNLNRGFVFQDSTNNRVGIDQSGNIRAQGVISSNNKQAMNCAHWSGSGNTTGAIKITLPGSYSGSYSMPVIEVTTYRYSGDAHVIYTISGHNWNNGAWYNTGVTTEGGNPLNVRLGHDGTNDCIIIGDTNTSWSYGSVTVALKCHPSIYASAQNMTSGWGISQITSMPAGVTAQTINKLWHTSNDGSGSGLDADLLDGYNSTNYVNKNGTSYYEFDTWLQSTSSHGFYSPSSGAGTHFYPGDLGDYGSFRTTGRKGGWGGYSIEGRAVFMHDGSSGTGIYNDANNQWLFYATHGAETRMYHNGAQHIYTYASGGRVTGNWLATGDVYAYYSDERLKIKTGKVENAIEKVKEIETFYYTHNEKAIELGYEGTEQQIGVSAQSVEKVLPEVVHLAPIDDDGEGNSVSGEEYKTVNYGRLVPLLIQAIKEQQAQIEELKEKFK